MGAVSAGAVLAACLTLVGVVASVDRWFSARTVERWLGLGPRGRHHPRGAPRSSPLAASPDRVTNPGARLALVVSEVAARLRAGSPTTRAWQGTWERTPELGALGTLDATGVPEGLLALTRAPSWADVGAGGWWGLPSRLLAVLRSSRARSVATRRAADMVVAACRFTHHLGAPLADVLERVADGIDESAAADDARRVAGQGPRTSTRVLTALPLVGILAGETLGAAPLQRFADGGVGTVCLVVGAACLVAGRAVSRSMVRRAEGRDEGLDAAIACDLVVAGLQSGASVPAVLDALGVATGRPDLGRIGRELVLGSPWGRAWDPTPAGTAIIADALEPAWTDGTSPVPLLERAASQVRARRVADARVRAEQLGVRLVVPLGALLLPAFVALGLVPILLHLGEGGVAHLW